jgi:hypothetical protein
MEDLFAQLGAAGIQRSSLYLTWDCTVASERNLSERMLHIRDDAFHQLGDDNLADGTIQGNSPTFSIDSSQTQDNVNENIARIVHGTVTVPCYMDTLRPRPARQRQRGRGRQRRGDGPRAQHHLLRDGLVRLRHHQCPQRPADPPGRLAVPAAGR